MAAPRYEITKNGPREYEKDLRDGRVRVGMITTWDIINEYGFVSEHATKREAVARLATLVAPPPMPHVRAKLARKGGNSVYRDKGERQVATLCGAPVTEKDVDFRTASSKAFAWGGWPICAACKAELAKGGR